MKRTLVGAAVLILMAGVTGVIIASAKGHDDGTKSPSQVFVDASHTGTEVGVAAGGSLTVTLESNATTGFQWQLVGSPNEAVLELEGHEYQPFEEARAGVLGAGGQEVWTFRAVGMGEETIDLEYGQPWEGGLKAAETFMLTVAVE